MPKLMKRGDDLVLPLREFYVILDVYVQFTTFTGQSLSHTPSRKNKAFEHHVSALSMLINHIKLSSDNSLLQQYILATSIMKILRRMKHPEFSKPFVDSLKAIDKSSIVFEPAFLKQYCSNRHLRDLIPQLSKTFNIPNLL